MRYEFHPEARVEYLEAVARYEERSAGLGARFTIEIETALRSIVEGPQRWRVLEEDVRRCRAHIFPYGVLYTVEENYILIVAVMHRRQRPGYWRSRVAPNRH